MNPSLNLVDHIIDFESGNLDTPDTIKLFQHLVDTGMAWTLQGFYGHIAAQMIDAGLITAPKA